MPVSDIRVYAGAADGWVSLRGPEGPAGPSVVSTNAGNLAKLGTDNRVLVAQSDLDARYVNVAGDTMTGALFITTPSTFVDALGQFQMKADGVSSMTFSTYSNTAGSSSAIRTYRARGTVAAPLPVLSGDSIGAPSVVRAWNGSSWSSAGGINFTATADTVAGAAWAQSRYSMNVGDGTRSVQVFLASHLAAAHYAIANDGSYKQTAAIATDVSYIIGQVGIGWTTPTRTLDVGGSAIIRGSLEATGNITSAGTAHSFAANSITASAISGLPAASAVLPLVDAATAVIGVSTAYARADHVHPLPTAAQVGGLTQAQADARYVELTGDWMSGPLALGGTAAFTTTAPLDIDATTYRVRQPKTPASQTDIGEQGTVCWDTAYLYCCVAPNQWRRQAWSDWSGAVTGAAWAPLATASPPQFAVSFGGDTFRADGGKWSVDGTNWYAGTGLPTGNGTARAAFGSGTFVTVAKSIASSLASFYTSSDGKAWTVRNVSVTGSSNRTGTRGVAFGAGRFVALMNNSGSSNGNVLPRHSVDGINWAASAAPAGLVANTLSDIAGVVFGSGLFVAVGTADSAGLATNQYLTSPDGVTWTARSLPLSLSWNDVAFGNGRFTAIAPGLAALTSIDGINWTQVKMPASADWETLTYGGGRWIAVAPLTTTAAISSDGITWTTTALPTAGSWNGIATNGTVFVATNGNAAAPAILTPTPQLVNYFPITASRTLVAGDANATVAVVTTNAAPVTLTIPTNAAVGFLIGTSITIMDASQTAVTAIKADTGVTLNWSGKLVGSADAVLGGVGAGVNIPGPLSQVILRKVAADSWTILY